MKLDIASVALRRARAAAMHQLLKRLVERLAPRALPSRWLARLG